MNGFVTVLTVVMLSLLCMAPAGAVSSKGTGTQQGPQVESGGKKAQRSYYESEKKRRANKNRAAAMRQQQQSSIGGDQGTDQPK